jgi:hypothetical protein
MLLLNEIENHFHVKDKHLTRFIEKSITLPANDLIPPHVIVLDADGLTRLLGRYHVGAEY